MTTTAHERAVKATYPLLSPGVLTEEVIGNVCKAYLQALLDDAETVEELGKVIKETAMLSQDSTLLNPIGCTNRIIATLKRMGDV